jgi:hypothetical protein
MHNKNKSERKEGFFRILVFIITGVILGIWGDIVCILIFINFLIMIFAGKRNKGLAEFCEIWNTQMYCFYKYMIGLSNKRPFPFNNLESNISKFE